MGPREAAALERLHGPRAPPHQRGNPLRSPTQLTGLTPRLREREYGRCVCDCEMQLNPADTRERASYMILFQVSRCCETARRRRRVSRRHTARRNADGHTATTSPAPHPCAPRHAQRHSNTHRSRPEHRQIHAGCLRPIGEAIVRVMPSIEKRHGCWPGATRSFPHRQH